MSTSGIGTIAFEKVGGKKYGNENFPTVTQTFTDLIAPLYGDQSQPLEKIQRGEDRRCVIMKDHADPVGLIVYKLFPTDEFASYGLNQSFEIKTLVVIDPKKNSEKGYGSKLIERIETVAKKRKASTIHVTVSASKDDSKSFFQKKGYKIMETWEGKYKKGETEYLMSKEIEETQPLL